MTKPSPKPPCHVTNIQLYKQHCTAFFLSTLQGPSRSVSVSSGYSDASVDAQLANGIKPSKNSVGDGFRNKGFVPDEVRTRTPRLPSVSSLIVNPHLQLRFSQFSKYVFQNISLPVSPALLFYMKRGLKCHKMQIKTQMKRR